ncbi:MAG: hypothetical protein ACREU3_17735 [Steroidobacteraceae bacterium]
MIRALEKTPRLGRAVSGGLLGSITGALIDQLSHPLRDAENVEALAAERDPIG